MPDTQRVTLPRYRGGVTAIEVPSGIKLFATDLDGTLLLPGGGVGDRTREALNALADTGVHIVFVTGRPPRWIHPVADATDHHGIAIGANGAVIIDMQTEILTKVRTMAPENALAAANALRAISPDVDFAVEYGIEGKSVSESFFAIGKGYTPRWEVPEHLEVDHADVLLNRSGITKLLARPEGDHSHDADSYLAAAMDALAGIVETTHSNPDDVLLEMSAHGVTKGSTLRLLAEELGIAAHEVAAVGDMPNDIPMLLWAGASYAVADAHPAAKSAAGSVIGPNSAESVADLIEAILAAQ